MKRTLSALLVSSALLCAAVLPTMAAESADPAQTDSAAVQEETMSDSELYYGQVQEIGRDEAGTITSLLLTSERYGEYVMNISGETVWIDSGERTASDPATLQVGESVYVYHSPVSTRSLPPRPPPSRWCAMFLRMWARPSTWRWRLSPRMRTAAPPSPPTTADCGSPWRLTPL